jgi:hypothetical protein
MISFDKFETSLPLSPLKIAKRDNFAFITIDIIKLQSYQGVVKRKSTRFQTFEAAERMRE